MRNGPVGPPGALLDVQLQEDACGDRARLSGSRNNPKNPVPPGQCRALRAPNFFWPPVDRLDDKCRSTQAYSGLIVVA